MHVKLVWTTKRAAPKDFTKEVQFFGNLSNVAENKSGLGFPIIIEGDPKSFAIHIYAISL